MTATETLETRPGEPRPPWSRRAKAVTALVVLLVAAVLVVVDLRVRHREELEVAGCARTADAVIRDADERVSGIVAFVRPVLANGPTGRLRRGMFRLISDATRGTDRRLVRVAQRCQDTGVLPIHPGLAERRDTCVRILRAHASYLARLATDGGAIDSWPGVPPAC